MLVGEGFFGVQHSLIGKLLVYALSVRVFQH